MENINKFEQDAEEIWLSLIDIYMIDEEKEIGRVISKLDDSNTLNIYKEMNGARKFYDYDDL